MDLDMVIRSRLGDNMVEIHMLGTGSWRSVNVSKFGTSPHSDFLVYHEGALHWIWEHDVSELDSIVSFDLEDEQFYFYSIPSPLCQQEKDFDIGVLGGCLCVYDPYADDYCIDIWAMKEYSVYESWTKLLYINMAHDPASTSLEYDRYQALIYLDDGALLMFHCPHNELMYYDIVRGIRFKHLKFLGFKSKFEAIAHSPSFILLNDIVIAGNVDVLNVNSRYR